MRGRCLSIGAVILRWPVLQLASSVLVFPGAGAVGVTPGGRWDVRARAIRAAHLFDELAEACRWRLISAPVLFLALYSMMRARQGYSNAVPISLLVLLTLCVDLRAQGVMGRVPGCQ